MKTKKICCHLAFAALLTISVSNGAKASFIIDIVQSGSNVVATGSGSINLAGLSLQASNIGGGEGLMVADSSGYGQIWLGPTSYNVDLYTGLNHGPTFGSGGQSPASSGSGTGVVFNSAEGLFEVATGYSSGTEFSDTSTWNGQTFTDLGITPGTYTYTWGSGGDADFMTLNIGDQTPEPGSLYLLGLGGAGLLLYCWRKRMVRAEPRVTWP